MMKCEAIKKSGQRCTYKAKVEVDGKQVCGIHAKSRSSGKSANKKPVDFPKVVISEFNMNEQDSEYFNRPVAGFDLDHTLIEPSNSSAKFIEGSDDWQFCSWFDMKRLHRYHLNGFRIVIFTNQRGVEQGKVTVETLKTRFASVAEAMSTEFDEPLPVKFMAATSKDEHRKPSPKMFIDCCSDGDTNDIIRRSFYVGDAAGRTKQAHGKKDFSASDYKFAMNAGIKFYTPEQFFLQLDDHVEDLDPRTLNKVYDPEELIAENIRGDLDVVLEKLACGSLKLKMVMLIGPPASGKSTFAQRLIRLNSTEYAHISQDLHKSHKACLTRTKQSLQDDSNVIIDNTNYSATKRKDYIEIAREYDCEVICVWFNVSKELSFHMNSARMLMQSAKKRVPDVAIHTYFKRLEPPSLGDAQNDGFDEIHECWSLLNDDADSSDPQTTSPIHMMW